MSVVVKWMLRAQPGSERTAPQAAQVVEVRLEPHEWEQFRELRKRVWDDAGNLLGTAEERAPLLNEMHVLVELKLFADARILTPADEYAAGLTDERVRAPREPEPDEPVTDAMAHVNALEARGFSIPQRAKDQMAVGQLGLGAPLRDFTAEKDDEPPAWSDSLKDDAAARAATAAGIAKVERGIEPPWGDVAYDAVCRLARLKAVFTPDDVWELVEKPREPRALGPVMLRAARDGVCEWTGNFVKSRIAVHHHTPIREYRSLVKEVGAGAGATSA